MLDKIKIGENEEKAINHDCGQVTRDFTDVETLWHDKLDGTIENAVLCWVSLSNEYAREDIALIVDKDEVGYYQRGEENYEWSYATPLSKDELLILIANAPDKVINV